MRIISPKLLRDFWVEHADAEIPSREWLKKAQHGAWKNFSDVRQTFPSADLVRIVSKTAPRDEDGKPRTKIVVIFNIGGNNYRLITSINYKTEIVYLLFALTHGEYDKNAWKKLL